MIWHCGFTFGDHSWFEIVLFQLVALGMGGIIDIDFSVTNRDALSRQTDHSFNVVAVWRLGRFENNNVAALRISKAVSNFIGQEIFAIFKIRQHRVAVDLVQLGNKDVHDDKERERQNDGFEDIADKEIKVVKYFFHRLGAHAWNRTRDLYDVNVAL